jgi:extracellular elastinolytic metalloproteinase
MPATALLAFVRTRTHRLSECTQRLLTRTNRLHWKRKTNPLRYSSLNGMTDYHGTHSLPRILHHSPEVCAAMGEVWANILHNVYLALADVYDWTWLFDEDTTVPGGNTIFFHLLFDALLLQPCNPTCKLFPLLPYSAVLSHVDTDTERTVVQARDAFIQAEANRYNNVDQCLLWRAFASRGLGVNAADYNDDTSVPSGCT